ncbi:MAG: SMI1/KNR4 family protein [Planctomycetota bacterium]
MIYDHLSIFEQLQDIAQRLQSMKLGDLHPFGAESHRFDFGTRLSEAEIRDFETQHHVTLPTDYRSFLQQVGDGGAGPAYGLFSLRNSFYDSNTTAGSLLAQPFPYTESYNPAEDPAFEQIYDPKHRAKCELSSAELYQHFRDLVSGTLPLCHEGCGYFHRLVITGPTRGEMWLDGRISDQGFCRLNVSFLEWYKRWYEDILTGNDGVWWLREDA